jgi:hypothetical protein
VPCLLSAPPSVPRSSRCMHCPGSRPAWTWTAGFRAPWACSDAVGKARPLGRPYVSKTGLSAISAFPRALMALCLSAASCLHGSASCFPEPLRADGRFRPDLVHRIQRDEMGALFLREPAIDHIWSPVPTVARCRAESNCFAIPNRLCGIRGPGHRLLHPETSSEAEVCSGGAP